MTIYDAPPRHPMPPEIAKAMIAATKAVESLAKEDQNQFGKYAYVSIDSYYEKLPKLLAEHGLFWRIREVDWKIVDERGKDGSMQITFEFDLYHESGVCMPHYSRFTFLHPLQGVQTTASATSYAEKIFARTLLKVPTGEIEGDGTDPKSLTREIPASKRSAQIQPPAPARALSRPAVKNPAPASDEEERGLPDPNESVNPVMPEIDQKTKDWAMVEKTFQTFLPECATEQEVRAFHTANKTVLDRMDADNKAARDRVRKMFNDRVNKIRDEPTEAN